MPINDCTHEGQARPGRRLVLILDEGWIRFSEASEALTAARAERDEWKVMACEYSECLQELCMKRLYDICRPASHAWLGMKHVGSIRMAVEFLIGRAEKAEADRDMLRGYVDAKDAELTALRERVARLAAENGEITDLNQTQFLELEHLRRISDAAHRLYGESEEYNFDDGLGRGAPQELWDALSTEIDTMTDAQRTALGVK